MGGLIAIKLKGQETIECPYVKHSHYVTSRQRIVLGTGVTLDVGVSVDSSSSTLWNQKDLIWSTCVCCNKWDLPKTYIDDINVLVWHFVMRSICCICCTWWLPSATLVETSKEMVISHHWEPPGSLGNATCVQWHKISAQCSLLCW